MTEATPATDSHAARKRIVILGGGFGGVYTAQHLESLCRRRQDIEIILVSRDNFLLMTPLLFEVCSGASISDIARFPSVHSCGPPVSSKPQCEASIWSAAWSIFRPAGKAANWPTINWSWPSGR